MVAAVVAGSEETALSALAEHGNVRAEFTGEPVVVARLDEFGVPAFELLIDGGRLDALKSALVAQGAVPIGRETADALRIEAGIHRPHAGEAATAPRRQRNSRP